jgi:hypothetical protein
LDGWPYRHRRRGLVPAADASMVVAMFASFIVAKVVDPSGKSTAVAAACVLGASIVMMVAGLALGDQRIDVDDM